MKPTQGDTEFSNFVSAHSGTLRHTAYLLTGHAQAAEDLLQDALVKTWLAWSRIDQVAAWWSYTRKIMVNLAADRWRKRRYETITMDLDDRTPSLDDGGFAESEDRAFIVRQLAQLSARELCNGDALGSRWLPLSRWSPAASAWQLSSCPTGMCSLLSRCHP